jgi:hypothetical protein
VWTALAVSIGLALAAAAPASAQIVAGQRADPAGDEVVTPPGAHAGLDLSGAAVRYDSASGELRITYRGTITVASHSGTFYGGVVSQTSSPDAGCGVAVAGDATFSGRTFTASGGGSPEGITLLEVKDVASIDGVVEFPSDGSIVFVFASPLLRNLDYRCAGALHARWIDSTSATTDDEVAPFCVVAGCFDPPPVGPVAGISTSEADSAVATGGPAPVAGSALPPDTVFVSAGLTARVAAALGGLRGLLGRGLTIPVNCSAGCEVRARVTSQGIVVARGSAVRLRGGVARLRLSVDGSARWSLAHQTAARVTIAVTIVDGSGADRTLVRRSLLR